MVLKKHRSVLLFLFAAAIATADEPHVSYIFPAGGQRGTTVEFRVGGHYLHDKCAFEMTGSGIDAPTDILRAPKTIWFEGPVIPLPNSQQKEDYPKDQIGKLSIAADAPLGVRRWRVSTSQGVTPSMPFVVGDLPETIEEEIDGQPIAVQVQTPVTINGRIFPREDVDDWCVDAKAGESYTCEVLAARIGSPLDSRIEVVGPDGQVIAENTDYFGADSFLRFTAAVDGEHHVRIHDINFDGLQHFVYRLTITSGVYVDRVYPLGGRRGEKVAFRLFGQNVGVEPLVIDLSHDKSTVFTHQVDSSGSRNNSFSIELSDFPEHLESDTSGQATGQLSYPVVLNGIIEQPGNVDSWNIEAKKDDRLLFDLRAERLGSHLDSVLTLFDGEGKQLAQSDDFAAGQSDSQILQVIPSDGVYTVRIEDRFKQRGGPEFAYRLYVSSHQPEFELHLPTDGLTVTPGAQSKLIVTAIRNRFVGDIDLQVQGLPDGVTTKDVKIDAKNNAQIVFETAETAVQQTARIQIIGTAKSDDKTITRIARLPKQHASEDAIDEVMLSVAIPTPFKVNGVFETKYAARGSTFTRRYSIDRGGFEGPITVCLADRQVRHLQGVTGPTIVILAGQNEFDYPIKLPPWMEIGRTSRTCVMAVGIVEDKQGKQHKVSYTSQAQNDQVIVLVDPGQLDVQADRRAIVAVPGQISELPVRVGRGSNITGDITVDLVVPQHIHGVACEPMLISARQNDTVLRLSFAEGKIGPFNMPLVIRVIAVVDGQPYTAETPVEIVTNE